MRAITDNFVFYKSWLDIIENNYPDDISTQSELIRNIVLYGIHGERNESTEKMFLQQAFAQIDSAKQKHDKRVDAGKKGGQSGTGDAKKRYGNQNASKRKQTQANKETQANNNINNNINKNKNIGIDIVGDNINTSAPTVCAPLKAAQPSVRWEVREDENGKPRFVKIECSGGDTT